MQSHGSPFSCMSVRWTGKRSYVSHYSGQYAVLHEPGCGARRSPRTARSASGITAEPQGRQLQRLREAQRRGSEPAHRADRNQRKLPLQ